MFSNAASRDSIVDVVVVLVGVIPVTSLLPPIPPKAEVKLVLLVIAGGLAVRSFVHFDCCGTAGGIGRIEFVRLGGLPGVGSLAF